MNTTHHGTNWPRAAFTVMTLILLLLASPARAQEAPEQGVRRLTAEQESMVFQTIRPKLDDALGLFRKGKAAEAIPIVKEIIALERGVLKQAASNPLEVERPPGPDPIGNPRFGLGGPSGILGEMSQRRFRATTVRAFEAQSLGSLEILQQLHETLGDFKAAKGIAEESAAIIAKLVGKNSWQAQQAEEEIQRLDRLGSLDVNRAKAIESARKAIGLVATSSGALGTAFCIDPRGIFVTVDEVAVPPSAQVITRFEYGGPGELIETREERSPKSMPMAVMLGLGGADVKVWPVRVLSVDKQSHLVLLKADSDVPLPALELAPGGSVLARAEAIALGLAAVNRIQNQMESPTPTVRARPGRVMSVRERDGRPWLYQLDSTPPAGYSGGPVVDAHGHVIGVIFVGLAGTDIHYIRPVDATTTMLAGAIVDFAPPLPLYRDRHRPRDWTVRIYSKTPLSDDVKVEVRVGTGSDARLYTGARTGDGIYTARAVPVAPEKPDQVELTLEIKPEPVRATVADREVRVGNTAVRLSELRRIEPGRTSSVLTTDGRRLDGPVTGLGVLNGRRGRQSVTIDTGQAAKVWLECPSPDTEAIEVEAVVKQAGKLLGRTRVALSYAEPPLATSRKIDPATVGLSRTPRFVETPHVTVPRASVGLEPTAESGLRK